MMRFAVYSMITLSVISLSACGTTAKQIKTAPKPQVEQRTLNIERTLEVAYSCLEGKEKKSVRVMYGVEGEQLVAAQVSAENKITPILLRDVTYTLGNAFRNGPVTWLAISANPTNVDKVNGNMLTLKRQETLDGKIMTVTDTVFQHCQLDSKTTRRLGREAAKQRSGSLKNKRTVPTVR